MITKLFAVRDSKVSVFGKPFVEQTEIAACRAFHIAANDPQIQFGIFPQDYDLYYLGIFDDVTGEIDALDQPKFLISAVSVKQMESQLAKKGESNGIHGTVSEKNKKSD